MRGLLRYDGPIIKYGNQFASLLWLNFLTLLCSVPIFTIGTSLTAMHYVTLQIVNDEDPVVTIMFFKAFKQNFKKATKLWLIYFIILLALAIDFQAIYAGIVAANGILKIALVVVTLIFVWIINWSFILMSRYENSIRHTVKNAILMIPMHPIQSFLILAALLIPIVMYAFAEKFFPIIIALGLTIPAYLQARVYRKVFVFLENNEDVKREP